MFLFLLFFFQALSGYDYSIAFVHVGDKLPYYAETSLYQARLFNPDCPIYLIGNEAALKDNHFESITPIAIESLSRNEEHEKFLKRCTYSPGLWSYSSERFLILYDFMCQYDVKHLFHMENDVMIYTDLNELMPIFNEKYKGIGAVFDNDNRCIPSFMYIQDKEALSYLARFFGDNFKENSTDMRIIAEFKNCFGSPYINHLPIVMPSYAEKHSLISPHGHVAKNPSQYYLHFDLFKSVFDAAAIGQYLGGIDPHYHGVNSPGFVNESCVFNPSRMTYEWHLDEKGRKVPFMQFNNKSYKINNLHIHCKDLKKFAS